MGQRGSNNPYIQSMLPLTKVVKILIIANVSIWLLFQVIIEQYFLPNQQITTTFGLVPALIIENFFIWQPFTYMFLHSTDGVMHIVFNMLLLWWLGAELEMRWGPKFFAVYYAVCGVGAGILYTLFVLIYGLVTGKIQPMMIPVVGASGAIFGLMLAYGMVFGERVVYFFFIFPMRAKYFVMILGGIEVVMVLNSGIGGAHVANLAHIGGLISGFLFLMFWTRWQRRQSTRGAGKGKLRLVVDNNDKSTPKYWN